MKGEILERQQAGLLNQNSAEATGQAQGETDAFEEVLTDASNHMGTLGKLRSTWMDFLRRLKRNGA